jgi:LmeA-like phospholipid-binding
MLRRWATAAGSVRVPTRRKRTRDTAAGRVDTRRMNTDPASLWGAWGGAAPVVALLRSAGRRLAGRRLAVPGTRGELSLCLASVDVRPDPVGFTVGQLDDVRVTATGVRWREWEAHRAVLVGHNVHVRPQAAAPPTVVSAPVTLELRLRVEHVRERLAAIRPDLRVEIGDGGARVRLARRPALGWLAVTPEVTRDALLLRPRALWLGRAGTTVPSWAPRVRIALPALPLGLRLRAITTDDGDVVLHLAADEWRGAPSLPSWLT